MDDRPEPDRFTPPISLLYDGFGVFDDVLTGRCQVPGEGDILETKLWDEVDYFAREMAKFYDNELERQDAMHHYLRQIFRARKDPQAVVLDSNVYSSRIGASHIISDGHFDGRHGAMVFCLECKNELGDIGISSDPSAKLVSCIARSFEGRVEGEHQPLFLGWRIPALGMS